MATSRREILKSIPAAALVAAGGAVPAHAIAPIARSGGPRLRLGLAGYSLRDHLTGKLTPAMTLDDFIEKAAAWEVDAVELTSYYFPPDFTPAYVAGLKRHCLLLGLDVSTTPIRNTFTHPTGPEREKEIAHVKRWLDVASASGWPFCASPAKMRMAGEPRSEAIASHFFTWAISFSRASPAGWVKVLRIGVVDTASPSRWQWRFSPAT